MRLEIKSILDHDAGILFASCTESILRVASLLCVLPNYYGSIYQKSVSSYIERAGINLREYIIDSRYKGKLNDENYGYQGSCILDKVQNNDGLDVTILCLDGTEVRVPRRLIYKDDGNKRVIY